MVVLVDQLKCIIQELEVAQIVMHIVVWHLEVLEGDLDIIEIIIIIHIIAEKIVIQVGNLHKHCFITSTEV